MRLKLTSFLAVLSLLCCSFGVMANSFSLKAKYMTIGINEKGYIVSLKDNKSKKEYSPAGHPSALLALTKGNDEYIYPKKAEYDPATSQITLTYTNDAVATLKADIKGEYVRFELLNLTPRYDIDNVVWGPYNTTISKTLGEIISVVRDDNYAIGIMALDDNTTSGVPTNGDMYQGCYIIHSPDHEKYPLPDSLYEGQRFRIGGDGMNDVAFYSQPEEYFRFMNGDGATLHPEFGTSISLHSRDRSKPHTILYPHYNDFPGVKSPRHMIVDPVEGVDYIGSSIAFYGCPDNAGLKVIENIVLNEGLPYITRNGKWIKDPASFCADIAWSGKHDSLVSYAVQLGIRGGIQDEGLGEYYIDQKDRWQNKKVTLNGERRPITDLTKETNKYGIGYGLHTLCEFTQGHSSYTQPEPHDNLCTMLRVQLTNDINAIDTVLYVADTSYLNERGSWDDNNTNALKIGKELITYDGVTTTKPYMLTGVKRGAYKTTAQPHTSGEMVAKLQLNCYRGFIPDIYLQDEYADFYAKLLVDGGMNYIDFDGYESCVYQGHGQYAFKRFTGELYRKFLEYGGEYLRIMGSCVFEGNWHYMSICNVGGGNRMYDPVKNKWGIQGKDFKYSFGGNYFPATFGIQNISKDWNVQSIDNLQAKAIGWDVTFMLGISEKSVESHPLKYEMFKTFRAWENARAANAFPDKLKKEMREEDNVYHIEQISDTKWKLYKVLPSGSYGKAVTLKKRS